MKLSMRFVIAFYGLMGALGWAASSLWLGLDPWRWPASLTPHDPLLALGVGVGVGLLTVFVSQLLDRYTTWAKRLTHAFARTLGRLTMLEIFIIAASSSLGEELLFRGFMQQALAARLFDSLSFGTPLAIALTSLVFGGLHVGQDRQTFLPWTIMAIVMGAVFGVMYWVFGGLEGPIAAHFTINFINLITITTSPEDAQPEPTDAPG